jgi:hypothetical protein
MARLLRKNERNFSTQFAFRFQGDRRMSSGSMRAYLQYRLFLLDTQIRGLFEELEIDQDDLSQNWDWMARAQTEEAFASWASLNYLMSVREELLQELDNLNPPTG